MRYTGGWKYSSTHSSPQQWMEVNGQLHAQAAFPSGENLDNHK